MHRVNTMSVSLVCALGHAVLRYESTLDKDVGGRKGYEMVDGCERADQHWLEHEPCMWQQPQMQ